MTRAQMAEMLRQRLQDVVEEAYADADVNTALNFGARYMQKEVMKLDPEAFFEVARADVVANQYLYEKPSNMIHEMALKLKDTSTGQYNRMKRKPYDVVSSNRPSGAESVYAHHGRFFYISPTPSASVVDGLELVHNPILSMSADSDVVALDINLHEGCVYAAELHLRGVSGEGKSENVVKTAEDLALVVNNIPLYYKKSAADPIPIDLSSAFHKDPY